MKAWSWVFAFMLVYGLALIGIAWTVRDAGRRIMYFHHRLDRPHRLGCVLQLPRMSVAKPNLTMVSSVTLAKSSGQHYRATGSL